MSDRKFSKRPSSLLCLLAGLAALPLWPQQTPTPRLLEHPTTESSGALGAPSQAYAVVIGIASYPNLPEEDQLHFTERDAESVYSYLISPAGGGLPTENVHQLVGVEATLANIRRELEEWLPSVAQENDQAIIYFAGHGYVHANSVYLAPRDVDPGHPAASGYPIDDLGRVIGQKIQARHKILLTDSCHSGAVTPESAANAHRINAPLDFRTSLFSLSASRDRETSLESKRWGGGHGVFTYYVIRGLEGEADADTNGVVTADELADYTRRNVREATGAKQNPAERGSYEPKMALAHLPEAFRARTAQADDPRFGGFAFESNRNGVEVFVDGRSAGVLDTDGPPLQILGLRPGEHSIRAVKMGYEPDGPRRESVGAGQKLRIRLHIGNPRRYHPAAIDEVTKGIEYYERGFPKNYRRAIEHFNKALTLDPIYSRAALFLGRAHSALYEYEQAKEAYHRALATDPDFLEARAGLGGMLLDIGDFNEAVLQLTIVVQREPDHALGHSMLAQAYRMKGMYAESIESARKAIELDPHVAEPHFFLADSLRLSSFFPEARVEYQQYLRLSDLESSKTEKLLSYWVRGFLIGGGKKKLAAQKDIWNALRSRAYLGLGECERAESRPDEATAYFQEALALDGENPQIHWALGLAAALKAEQTGDAENLRLARKHFAAMVRLNEHLEESEKAKELIRKIDGYLQQH